MDARAKLKNRLRSRHLTEGSSRAPGCRFDMAEIFKKTSDVADLRQGGRDVAKDKFEIGAISLLMKTLLDNGHLRGDCITATGRTIAEDLKSVTRNPRRDACAPDGVFEVA